MTPRKLIVSTYEKRYSPQGKLIIGTYETVEAMARIIGFRTDGEPIHDGTTDIWWDTQETQIENGHRLFVDESFNIYPEYQLRKTKPRKKAP